MRKRANIKQVVLGAIFLIVLAIAFSIVHRILQRPTASSPNTGALPRYPSPETPFSQIKPDDTNQLTFVETPPEKTLSPEANSTLLIDENGWYIYHDDEVGFSFSYPPDLVSHITAGKSHVTPGEIFVNLAYRFDGIGGTREWPYKSSLIMTEKQSTK